MHKTAIITGASSGYGLAMAKAFKDSGFSVLITARSEQGLLRAQADTGADFFFVQDVTDYSGWERLRDYAAGTIGDVDVLVNNAGGGLSIQPIEAQSKETIDAIVALNLNSVMYAAHVFAPQMKARRRGTIINIASVCATHAWADWSVYAAAKAGVRSFTKGLQVELQPHGVRATCIIPASASTGFQAAAGIGETRDSLTAEDVAGAALYAATLPERAICEELTVWGMSQTVQPL